MSKQAAQNGQDTEAAAGEAQGPMFNIEKIYVKDMSVELPNAPGVFLEQGEPEISVELNNGAQQVGDGFFEVTLTATVTSKMADKTVFLVEVKQCGIFQIRSVPDVDLGPILGITCPNILFPYAREAVADMIGRAGFPPIHLAPVPFDVLYQQARAQEAEKQQQVGHA